MAGASTGYTICKDSSRLLSWGHNSTGQLGYNKYPHSYTPVKAIGMTGTRFITSGYGVAAIKDDNTGWVWGALGGLKPVYIINDVVYASAGVDVCSFIKEDGTVWSIGYNNNGLFGNGKKDSTYTLVPQKMSGINSAVRVAIAGSTTNYNGIYGSVITILLSDGTVMTIGSNLYGLLGNNSANSTVSTTPVSISGLKDIIDIKSNNITTIALDKHGDVYTWGAVYDGNGTTPDNYIPQKIASLKNIVAISGINPGNHFLALDSARNCYAWGNSAWGQTGTTTAITPTLVATDVVDIMAGRNFSYIIKKDSSLWATGSSAGGSIWMNLSDVQRNVFTHIDPTVSPMQLCKPSPVPFKIRVLQSIKICIGDSFKVGKNTYMNEGSYKDTLQSWENIDSIVTTRITYNPVSNTYQKITLCKGDQFKAGMHIYTSSGIYHDTLSNYTGCDSIIITDLTVNSPVLSGQNIKICRGGSYSIGKNKYLFPGTYFDTFPGYEGCDSILTTHLSFYAPATFIQTVKICNGEIYSIGKNKYTNTGTFIDTIPNYIGCDSIVTTILRVASPTAYNQSVAICPGYTYVIGKSKYALAGIYTDTLVNQTGCDSVVTTTLIVKPGSNYNQTISICAGEQFSVGKNRYNMQGTYHDTFLNSASCDSLVTTVLVIKNKPIADFTFDDKLYYTDDIIQLINLSKGSNRHRWHFGGTTGDSSILFNPSTTYKSEGERNIRLISIDSHTECSDTAFHKIHIHEMPKLFIPSAFSPNGDGLNDLFYPVTKNFDLLKMNVFNRWGESLFVAEGSTPGWDGRYKGEPCIKGVYMYIMEFYNTVTKKTHKATGVVFIE